MVELAGLHFVERDDDIFEEDDMLFTQGDSEATDDRGQDVQQFSHTIEFVGFMDQGQEAIIFGFSNHFTTGH